VVLGDDCVEFLLGILGVRGEISGNMAQDCELLGLKNWSICSVMGLSVIRSDHFSLEIPLVK
jgi:hypothetical protein